MNFQKNKIKITAKNSFILSTTSLRPCKQNNAFATVDTASAIHCKLFFEAEIKLRRKMIHKTSAIF